VILNFNLKHIFRIRIDQTRTTALSNDDRQGTDTQDRRVDQEHQTSSIGNS
jgi:hypothetical protein